ncbi:hypothetical protein Llac01_15200 [Leuconostoc lactis]|nr:hypothetical protein Llac01_15200 [Leuconostoc lactis]
MTTVYFKLEKSGNYIRQWASTDKNIVLYGGFPVSYEVYNGKHSREHVIQDTLDILNNTYHGNIQLIEVQPKEMDV